MPKVIYAWNIRAYINSLNIFRPEHFLRAPFDPYERPHYGTRDYPIPQDRDVYRRDYPPHYERDYLSRDDPYRRPEFRPPPPQRVRPAIDCEVISLSKEER